MTLGKKPFENIVGKGEYAGNQHFLLFPQCFSPFQNQNFKSLFNIYFVVYNAFNLDQTKILSLGTELIPWKGNG